MQGQALRNISKYFYPVRKYLGNAENNFCHLLGDTVVMWYSGQICVMLCDIFGEGREIWYVDITNNTDTPLVNIFHLIRLSLTWSQDWWIDLS